MSVIIDDAQIDPTKFEQREDVVQTTRIRPRVSPHVALEAPRMFSSFKRALREVFQNAYRAGATRVDVRWNRTTAVLEITDDGPGLAHPQILLDAGTSNWSPAEIIDAAGLGFFALFNPSYVETLEIISQGAGNWRMRLTPDDIRRAVEAGTNQEKWIPIEPLPEIDQAHGLNVRIGVTQKERANVQRDMLIEARAQYPYQVIYVEDGKSPEILPFYRFERERFRVETSVGPAYWKFPTGLWRPHAIACWECVPIYSAQLNGALSQAVEIHPNPALADLAAQALIQWNVDPRCAVRPRLPERDELLGDAALRAAACTLVFAIAEDMLSRARADFATAPDRIVVGDIHAEPYKEWLVGSANQSHGHWSQSLLKQLGYARVELVDGAEVVMERIDDDSWDAKFFMMEVYSRTAPILGDEHLAATLNFLGREVAHESNAALPTIHISGLCEDRNTSPYIALAERIEVQGIGELPFLIQHVEGEYGPMTRIVYVGDAEQCVGWLQRQAWPINYVFVANQNGEWVSLDGDEYVFERDEALEQVIRCVAKAWARPLEDQLRLYYDLQRALHCMEECLRSADSAARWLEPHKTLAAQKYHPRLEVLSDQIGATKDDLSRALERVVPAPLVDAVTK